MRHFKLENMFLLCLHFHVMLDNLTHRLKQMIDDGEKRSRNERERERSVTHDHAAQFLSVICSHIYIYKIN